MRGQQPEQAMSSGEFGQFARGVQPRILWIMNAGMTSHRAIARELNFMRVPSATGKAWSGVAVAAVLARLDALTEAAA